MKTRISFSLLLLISVMSLSLNAAVKTAVFNGKTYRVYPQYVDIYHNYVGKARINFENFEIMDLNVPPIIGEHEDGEYILYTTDYDLKYKGKYKGEKYYDTIYNIYATFTIKNNQKNGWLYLYKAEDSKTAYFKIPYENDLINGSFYYDDSRMKYYGKNKYNTDLEELGIKLKKAYVTYKNGFPDGIQKSFYYTKSNDSLLDHQELLHKGVLNGWSIDFSYSKYKKNIAPDEIDSSFFIDGKKDGISIERLVFKGNETIIYRRFKKGEFLSKEIYYGKKLVKMMYLSSDSILKYVKDALTEEKLPRVGNFSKDNDYVYIDKSNPQSIYITYAIGNHVRNNFYKKYSYYKDTIINGNFFLYEKSYTNSYEKIYNGAYYKFYRIDTCSGNENSKTDTNTVNEYEFCTQYVFSYKKYNNGVQSKPDYMPAYFEVFKDSVPILIDKSEYRHLTIHKYYYPLLKYSYWNLEFKSGKMAGCKEYYIVKGTKSSGFILHCFKLPLFNYDTLYCYDTLMRGGKFLYHEDDLFKSQVSNLLKLNSDKFRSVSNRESQLFSVQFFNFLLPLPIRHTLFTVGKKPFTGWFNIDLKYKHKANELDGGVFEVKSLLSAITKEEFISVKIELDRNFLRILNENRFVIPPKRIFIYLSEGKFEGEMGIINRVEEITTRMQFSDNKINSSVAVRVKCYNYNNLGYNTDDETGGYYQSSSRYRRKYNRSKYNKLDYKNLESNTLNYLNGKREGQWYNYGVSQTYRQGVSHGQIYNYEVSEESNFPLKYLSETYSLIRDTVNGEYWKLFPSGWPNLKGNFKMGIPDGVFYRYNDEDTSGNKFLESVSVEKGFLNGQYLSFRDSGGMRMSIDLSKDDSIYFDMYTTYRKPYDYDNEYEDEVYTELERHSKSINEDLTQRNCDYFIKEYPIISPEIAAYAMLRSYNFKRGYYKLYYSNGNLFAEGYKKYDKPYDTWKFYRENGKSIYKIIEFKDSVIYNSPNDSFHTYGKVTAFHEDGKVMFTGWATDLSSKYSCESGAETPTEDDAYITFYDTLGNAMPINDSCFIVEYQMNGYKLKEGLIVNGKKTGIWIYYSRYGLPISVGRFVNGKKEGRWLSGDLSGLNLSEEVCLMSSEEFMIWIKLFGGNLRLGEIYYENGILINSNFINTIQK